MAVDGSTSPSNGVSMARDGVEDGGGADLLPRSPTFPGRGLAECHSREGNSKRQSFAPGDLVWGKAFPYTWWPGWVRKRRGSARLVSFFGVGSISRWLQASNIRGFEDCYLQMSKMAGARLAREVDGALRELSRRTALAMSCGCRRRAVGAMGDEHLATQMARERERFEPSEVVDVVLGMAVRAWVDDGQTICAARVAAQVYSYRRHVSVASVGVVDVGFEPAETLDMIRCLGVSAWRGDGAAAAMARVVGQLDAYRHFMSIRSDWGSERLIEDGASSASEDSEGIYQRPTEEGSSSSSEDSEGSHLEIPYRYLDESEEADDVDILYENGIEEQGESHSLMQENVPPDGEICKINRIDYSILDTEFDFPTDNKMENAHDWSGEKRVAIDTEKPSDVLPINKDHHDDSTDDDTCITKFSSRYASLAGVHGTKFDQTVVPDASIEMPKVDDFSLHDASTTCFLEFITESTSQFIVGISLKPQLSLVAAMFHGEEGSLQFLRGMLYHLYCLASEPLYMRSESLMPLCQIVLSYKALMFQRISELPTITCSEASQNAQEPDTCGHDHLTNESGEKHQDDNVADMCEHSGLSGVLFHTFDDGIELQFSAKQHDDLDVPHTVGDSITTHSSMNVNTSSKNAIGQKYTSGIMFHSNSVRRLSGKIVVDKRYAASSSEAVKRVCNLTFPVNRDYDIVNRKRKFREVSSATSISLHAASSLCSDVKAYTMSMMLDNKKTNDAKSLYCKQSDTCNEPKDVFFQDDSRYDALAFQSDSNFCAAADTSGNNVKSTAVAFRSALAPICGYKVSSGRKRRPDRPVNLNVSKWQKYCPFTSVTQFYASPLIKDSSSTIDRAQCSPVIGRKTGPSSSLHMKFPKGVNLPSKEDLERIFSVFGPLDHSRTKVFFYTGAGKVVFSNPTDAETAYNYVRRNKIFETGMRFWLDPHEKLRKEDSPQASPLSGGQTSALSLKSCLKSSTIHGNKDTKGKFRVTFCT